MAISGGLSIRNRFFAVLRLDLLNQQLIDRRLSVEVHFQTLVMS